MKVTLTNDSTDAVWVEFGGEPDWNMNPGAEVIIQVQPDSEIKFRSQKVETKNVKRPDGKSQR